MGLFLTKKQLYERHKARALKQKLLRLEEDKDLINHLMFNSHKRFKGQYQKRELANKAEFLLKRGNESHYLRRTRIKNVFVNKRTIMAQSKNTEGKPFEHLTFNWIKA